MERARNTALVVVALLMAVSGCSSQVEASIYGDGSIRCPDHVADDLSLPVGTVEYQGGPGEIHVRVVLSDAAPGWRYNPVELWTDESCSTGGPVGSSGSEIVTDGDGRGEIEFVVTGLEPGSYMVNINISSTDQVPDDPRHREMGTAVFTEVVVSDMGA